MEATFWLDRWSRSRIGFHQSIVEPSLQRHWNRLGIPDNARVFVPLCGKSLDLVWLHDAGHTVVANELSELAAESFFSENGISARRRVLPSFQEYQSLRLTLLCGNFFDLTESAVGEVAAVYDRAALIAWPPESRSVYARHLSDITRHTASLFLIVLEYPQAEYDGPPFSVEYAEIRILFEDRYDIVELERRDVLNGDKKMRDRGVTTMFEVCYHLTPKR